MLGPIREIVEEPRIQAWHLLEDVFKGPWVPIRYRVWDEIGGLLAVVVEDSVRDRIEISLRRSMRDD
jgi:hypothetical protein